MRYLLACAITLSLCACSPDALRQVFTPATQESPAPATPQSGTPAAAPAAQQETVMDTPQAGMEGQQKIVEIGSGNYISPSVFTLATSLSQAGVATEPGEGDITLNFQGTSINEFIKVILGDIF
mgnify:FL=1